MGRRLIQQYGPPGLVLDGESRSHSNEIVADYLTFAHSGRAWYLIDDGSSYERRWHAKCRTPHSDCAVIRHKSRADGWQCPSCGAPSEDATHVYLECPAHSGRRDALLHRVHQLCAAAAGEGVPLVPAQAMAWVHTDSPALISLEAVEAGGALRREAMAFYATAQQVRYCAHRGQPGLTQPPQLAPHVESGPKAISQAQHITARPPV